jgi:hypothetical protein
VVVEVTELGEEDERGWKIGEKSNGVRFWGGCHSVRVPAVSQGAAENVPPWPGSADHGLPRFSLGPPNLCRD